MKKIFAIVAINLFLIKIACADGLASLFPHLEGWELKVESQEYTADNLWELINGAADVFLIYGFQDLHIGEYANNSGDAVRVELYRHSTSNNTYGIYTSERMPDYTFINIGTEGYTSFGALNFFAGEYYVKIFWSGQGEASEPVLKEVADKIEISLQQQASWPEELSLFPKENRLEKTDGFTSESFLGYSFLNNAFTVGYNVNDAEFKMFIINLPTVEQAKALLIKYFETIKHAGYNPEVYHYVVDDPYNGKVGIGIEKSFLYGIIQSADGAIINQNLTLLGNCIGKK
ncbi:MAG: DUF6599 family protein [Bacteroidales bacterium]